MTYLFLELRDLLVSVSRRARSLNDVVLSVASLEDGLLPSLSCQITLDLTKTEKRFRCCYEQSTRNTLYRKS